MVYRQGMTADPRAALESLIVAFERHLEAASSTRDPESPLVAAASADLADAFDVYDEALFDATGVPTPLDLFEGEDEDEEYDPHADEDDDGVYAGLDGEEFDDEDFDDADDERPRAE